MSDSDNDKLDSSISSISSLEEEFWSNPIGYRFEPEFTEEEIRQNRNALSAEKTDNSEASVADNDARDRLLSKYWCTCKNCIIMPSMEESICCHENAHTHAIVDGFDPPSDSGAAAFQMCITEHPDFSAHINSGVLSTFFLTNRINWKKFPAPQGPHGTLTNNQYRLVSYRHILEWFLKGERLGEKNRIPLPSCIVAAIRNKYPSNNDEYAGFKWTE